MVEQGSWRGNGIVGLLREENNKWERRAPLAPHHCTKLLRDGVKRFLVQPSSKRIYRDALFKDAGCEITDDLSECGLIIGVKQPQAEYLLPDRSYACFSHTRKAQPENLPLLDKVLEKRISLFDYELIESEKKRLVYFGQYAGYAGMIDALRGLGEWFLSLKFSTPFLSLGSAYMYTSLVAAKQAVLAIGEEIKSSGLPPEICPLIFIFTGTGNVSRGAQEIFKFLPHEFVTPEELSGLTGPPSSQVNDEIDNRSKTKGSNFKVYGCVVSAKDMVVAKHTSGPFDKTHYYTNPEEYTSVFAKNIVPHASIIVNCMYWEQRFPRLLTNDELLGLRSRRESRLMAVADISCDKGGSIEFHKKYTTIESPFYRYHPEEDSIHNDMDGPGILYMAVDCLPTELAKESTEHFGEALSPFICSMAHAKKPEDTLVPVREACIAHNGALTKLYKYIPKLRETTPVKIGQSGDSDGISSGKLSTVVSLSGHLFDQHLINEALDVICNGGGCYRLATWELGQSDFETSRADLEMYTSIESSHFKNDRNFFGIFSYLMPSGHTVSAESKESLAGIVDQLAKIAVQGKNGNTSDMVLERRIRKELKQAEDMDREAGLHVLILGAGRMCEPAVKYLASTGRQFWSIDMHVSVVVASLYLEDSQKVVAGYPNVSAIQLDTSNVAKLEESVSKANVVISLLPADFHIPVARACIKLRKHLITASYVSEDMQALDEKAKEAGVTLLCEMGLDPGIDHMMAMKMIDSAHKAGGRVQSFVSYCGGLPAPEAANNPLGYKFSWNPAGAIKAGRNPAVYLKDAHKVEIPGEKLFLSAMPVRLQNAMAFALERLPNRDSLKYGELYGISNEATTIFRSTLRYEGFSEIMDALGELGYFSTNSHPLLAASSSSGVKPPTYSAILESLISQLPLNTTQADSVIRREDFANTLARRGCCRDLAVAEKTATCIRWLGLDSPEDVPEICKSTFDVLCRRMEEKLTYGPDEQDMVLLHHELEVVYEGRVEQRTATLLALGETIDSETVRPQSAMARTVGLPAAIAAQLLLFDEVKTRGVVRPLGAEVYEPALKILDALKVSFVENVQTL